MRRGGHEAGNNQLNSPAHGCRSPSPMHAQFKRACTRPYLAIPGCTSPKWSGYRISIASCYTNPHGILAIRSLSRYAYPYPHFVILSVLNLSWCRNVGGNLSSQVGLSIQYLHSTNTHSPANTHLEAPIGREITTFQQQLIETIFPFFQLFFLEQNSISSCCTNFMFGRHFFQFRASR